MYATCLYCHSALGRNESFEYFPVGRRLAYDQAKGRLWVICTKCERWNLSPLETRWETIEDAERVYRETKKRVATDNVGLARLRDGTDLIRIGAPLRPEFAAWRYGDAFGRRRRRHFLYAGAGVVGTLGAIASASALGVGAMVGPVIVPVIVLLGMTGSAVRIPDGQGSTIALHGHFLSTVRISLTWSGLLHVRFSYADASHRAFSTGTSWGRTLLGPRTLSFDVTGERARNTLTHLLPAWNGAGARKSTVSNAVARLEQNVGVEHLIKSSPAFRKRVSISGLPGLARELPLDYRLALEMSLHEESERRAMEGELEELHRRWKEAEEIARIADSLALGEGVTDRLTELRKRTDGPNSTGHH